MRTFRVRFCNALTDSSGHEHHVCQREIEVTSEAGKDDAIAQAIREFEKAEQISNWRARAHHIECEPK